MPSTRVLVALALTPSALVLVSAFGGSTLAAAPFAAFLVWRCVEGCADAAAPRGRL